MLILLAFALDLGRVFLGWVNLNNSVRVAANYAAQNPSGWNLPGPNATKIEYERLVTADADVINCDLPSPIPDPTFLPGPTGHDIGQPVTVGVTCRFHLITPILSFVLGNGINVSATSAFPIRAGVINGIPVQSIVPIPTASVAPSASPSASASAAPSASASVAPSPTPTPTPAPCIVPNLVGQNTRDADNQWGPHGHGAGFLSPLTFNPLVGGPLGHYIIGHQTLTPGTPMPCVGTTMTVSP
jgi:hypothetical protein